MRSLAALLFVGTAGCATAAQSGADPRSSTAAIDSVLASAPLDQVQWGVLATEARTGRTIYAHQPTAKFIPGSNMKVPVVAAALHLLGPEHRFETPLHAAGTLDRTSGLLSGDLVLAASGDPTLSARFHPNAQPLRALVDSLRAAGVREVSGSLVVDASAWDSTLTVASWMVEDLADAATGGAFVLAEGVTTVVVQAGVQPGDLARVSWEPRGADGFIVSRITTARTPAEVAPYRTTFEPESHRLILDGRIAAGDVDTLRVGTRDPVRQAGAALARALADGGIRVRSGWRIAWTAGEQLQGGCSAGALDRCTAPVLARLQSPPLIDIAAVILGPSHNWMAEQVVRALGRLDTPPAGAPSARPPASWTTGLAVVRRYLVETVGVDSLDLRLRDGSGLSAQNVITPRALVQILTHVRAQPWGEAFRNALAEPAETGTTLSARLPGLQGRVHAKSGTLTNVATLSGYAVRPDGELITFAIMTNGSGLGASRVQPGIDRIVRALAGG